MERELIYCVVPSTSRPSPMIYVYDRLTPPASTPLLLSFEVLKNTEASLRSNRHGRNCKAANYRNRTLLSSCFIEERNMYMLIST